MRLVTIRTAMGTRAGRLDGDQVTEVDSPDVGALLAGSDWVETASRSQGQRHALADVELAPVVPHPSKIICLGLNYLSHIEETGAGRPQHPALFAKFQRALIGPRDSIVLPLVSDSVDWEVELAFVMGRRARHVRKEDALATIGGFTVLNDVSVRDWQMRTQQYLQGKTFESTTPVGPALVTTEEIDASDLLVRCEVDGNVMQEARTSELLFTPADIVEYVSHILTLDPGDLIATGTPAGIGAGRRPPLFLQPGQVVRTSIEGLGELVNTCIKEAP
jgi:acylpyruvate hydrolase